MTKCPQKVYLNLSRIYTNWLSLGLSLPKHALPDLTHNELSEGQVNISKSIQNLELCMCVHHVCMSSGEVPWPLHTVHSHQWRLEASSMLPILLSSGGVGRDAISWDGIEEEVDSPQT